MADKSIFVLSEDEKAAVFEAIGNGDTYLAIKGEMVSLQIVPTILRFEKWYAQENQRLALTNRRLCKNCLSRMDATTGCPCWKETNKGEDRNALEGTTLPQNVRELLSGSVKSFPALTDEDRAMIAAEKPKYIDSAEADESDFYISESGERHFS